MQIHELFINAAIENKSKVAIYDQASHKEYTYEQMLIACMILQNKVHYEEKYYVGIMVPTSAGCIIAILAVLMSGRIPVMINYSTGAISNCLFAQKKCGFQTIITSIKLLEKLQLESLEGMIFMEDITSSVSTFDKIYAFFKSHMSSLFIHKGEDDDNAIILFTSGSEKNPKAVQLTHRNFISNIEGIKQVFDFTSDDVFISVLPLFHVFGLTTACFLPLTMGCSVVTHASPLEYEQIVSSIRNYQVTTIIATPTFFNGYLKKSEPGDFKSIKYAVAGGDKLMDTIREGFLSKHNLTICEGYGTTETSPVISSNSPQKNKPGSIGLPLPNLKIRIVNIDTFEEVGVNTDGKILVKGDLVMRGYLGDMEETYLRIRNGWYDTGDIGKIDADGYLWHSGRLRRFVKIGGEMISLTAVENELEKLLPEGGLCCVVEVPHPIRGSEILAAVTSELDKSEAIKMLGKNLPAIAIPKKFIFFRELPLMGSGKVNFREVTEVCQHIVLNSEYNDAPKHKKKFGTAHDFILSNNVKDKSALKKEKKK